MLQPPSEASSLHPSCFPVHPGLQTCDYSSFCLPVRSTAVAQTPTSAPSRNKALTDAPQKLLSRAFLDVCKRQFCSHKLEFSSSRIETNKNKHAEISGF